MSNPQPSVSNATIATHATSWPESLRSYVEAIFKLATSQTKKYYEQELKLIVKESMNRGDVWTRDWTVEPFPDL